MCIEPARSSQSVPIRRGAYAEFREAFGDRLGALDAEVRSAWVSALDGWARECTDPGLQHGFDQAARLVFGDVSACDEFDAALAAQAYEWGELEVLRVSARPIHTPREVERALSRWPANEADRVALVHRQLATVAAQMAREHPSDGRWAGCLVAHAHLAALLHGHAADQRTLGA